jgi:hypothetical protein
MSAQGQTPVNAGPAIELAVVPAEDWAGTSTTQHNGFGSAARLLAPADQTPEQNSERHEDPSGAKVVPVTTRRKQRVTRDKSRSPNKAGYWRATTPP